MAEIRVVITGASGFIGMALLKRLCTFPNLEVIAVHEKKSNIYRFDKSFVKSADFVVHLAEPNSEHKISQNFEKIISDAKINAQKLIDLKFKNIIYFSSASVYNKVISKSLNESDSVVANNKYSMMKLEIEEIFYTKANSVILRPSNVYGPGMSKENVMSRILSQLNQSGPITVRNLNSVRDFIYIDDVCEVITKLIFRIIEKPLPNNIYNLGTGTGTSILNLVEILLRLSQQTNRRIKSEFLEECVDSLVLDISLIKKDLSWSPKTTLINGLSRLLNGY